MKKLLTATWAAIIVAAVSFLTFAPVVRAGGHGGHGGSGHGGSGHNGNNSGHHGANSGPGSANSGRGHHQGRGGNNNDDGLIPPVPGATPDDHGNDGLGHH